MRNPLVTAAVIAVGAATATGVTLATAGGSTPTTPSASRLPAAAPALRRDESGVDAIRTAKVTVQGRIETILVDAKGLPLYIHEPDTATISYVTGQLAALWPPLTASKAELRPTDRVLTLVATGNGEQVAYRGHFLYTFVEDRPGRVTGQGVQDFFVATPGLLPIAAQATAGSGSSGAGW